MNTTDLRKLNREALKDKLTDLKEELFNLRFQHAINQLENPNKLKEVKRDIARVKTIMRAHELSIEEGYAELDASEVPVEEEKPAKKTRSRAAKASEETVEEKPKTRSRKTAKAEAEPVAEAEETEEIAETEEAGANVEEAAETEEAEESAADQEAQDEETPAPQEEE